MIVRYLANLCLREYELSPNNVIYAHDIFAEINTMDPMINIFNN